MLKLKQKLPKNKRFLIPLVVILIILLVIVGWVFTRKKIAGENGLLKASGTIEAIEVIVGPEISGRVAEVYVDKGNFVKANDPLLRLDEEILQSQLKRALTIQDTAQASLSAAEAGYAMAEATLRAGETNLEVAEASSKAELIVAQQALEELNENADVARSLAYSNVAAANRAVREAQYRLDNFTIPSNQKGLSAMQAVDAMRKILDDARSAFEPFKYESENDPTREDLLDSLEEAQSDFDTAVRRLEYETDLAQAQSNLEKALQELEKVQNGPDPDKVAVLEAQIEVIKVTPKQSEATIEQAKVGVEQAKARLDQAEATLDQANAELELIEVQLDKVMVYAPAAGVVLSRDIEPGEVIQPGTSVMSIGQLDSLKIVVYIPEDQYGQIKLGDKTQVTVDSFPKETFIATVVHIADQAEFTPRNVQTSEGRKTTVFAVELSIENLEGKLKPGMPADVCFGCRQSTYCCAILNNVYVNS